MHKRLKITGTRAVLAIGLSMTGFALAVGAAAAQEPANVAGDWSLEVTTDAGGTTTPSVTLEQDGTPLTGHYSSEALGEHDVTGTINGNDFDFEFEGDVQGQSLDVTYTGTRN